MSKIHCEHDKNLNTIPPIFFGIPMHSKEVDFLIDIACDEIKKAEKVNNYDVLQFLNNMLYNLKDFATNYYNNLDYLNLKIHVYELDYLITILLTNYSSARDNENNIVATQLLHLLKKLLPLNQIHISLTNHFWREYDSKEKRAKTLKTIWLLANHKK